MNNDSLVVDLGLVEELFFASFLLLPPEIRAHLVVCPVCTQRFVSQFISLLLAGDEAAVG